MPRKKEVSPEEQHRREKAKELIDAFQVTDLNELQSLMKEMMKQVVEVSLEGELDEELGYTRYDYRQKDTENSRNRFSKKLFTHIWETLKLKSHETEMENLSPNW